MSKPAANILRPTLQESLLEAALTVFSRYGFRMTTMALLAEAGGLSRPALYLRYANKSAVFAAVAEDLVSRALKSAEAAWRTEADLADNLSNLLLAKDLPLFRLIKTTPHGAELLSVDANLTAHAVRTLNSGAINHLASRLDALAKSGRIRLDGYDSAEDFARQINALAGGLKHEFSDEDSYAKAVKSFTRLIARATG
jgi:AcrR family transcriptional regulator